MNLVYFGVYALPQTQKNIPSEFVDLLSIERYNKPCLNQIIINAGDSNTR